MDQKQKSRISSKISKIDKEIQFISQNLQCSDQIKKALVAMKKTQKKKQHRRLNKDQQRGWSKKKVNLLKFFNFINMKSYLIQH